MTATADRTDRPPLPVDATLRRVAVIFRLLGWAWMTLLAVVTLIDDDKADPAVVAVSLALVTVWTGVTLAVRHSHNILSSSTFVVADGLVAVFALASGSIAESEHLFSGGYPMSWLGIAAYAWGIRGAVAGSVVLAVEQGIVEYLADRPAVPIAGSVTFVVFAIVAGWGFTALRRADRARLDAFEELTEEQRARARFEERAEMANRLHDSVLQTLIAIRRESDDEGQVRYLARRQERELRGTIDEYRSPFARSLRAQLLQNCAEVEDLYRVEIDAVVRGDGPADGAATAVVIAAREALINAAKHSGQLAIDLYAVLGESHIEVFVRDRGRGFDPASAAAGGIAHSLKGPVERVGGTVRLRSAPGKGTEVVIVMEPGDG